MRTVSLRVVGILASVVWFTAGIEALSAPPAPAPAAPDPVKMAIAKGVNALQMVHEPSLLYTGGSHGIATASLAGLALLEGGVSPTDPALCNIIAHVRINALAQTKTYEISLTIMLLDRLGTLSDRHMIQFLGLRLLTGQFASGGWSYDCNGKVSEEDVARLTNIFLRESRITLNTDPKKELPKKEVERNKPRNDLPVDPNSKKPMPKTEPKKKETSNQLKSESDGPALHPEVARYAKFLNIQRNGALVNMDGGGDNSNTQFAILALWIAQKHGVPCEPAFKLIDRRFRTCQNRNGGWDYNNGASASPAMTCAGLIGLAASRGSAEHVLRSKKADPATKNNDSLPDPGDDSIIQNGLKCLGGFITQAKNQGANRDGDEESLSKNLYFMWSLERVGVIYGLDTIGNNNWYAWGSEALVKSQNPNGSWSGKGYPGANPELNTCFAVLFLSRCNVAKDLTALLQGKYRDPGVSKLSGRRDITQVLPDKTQPVVKPPAPPTPPTQSDTTQPVVKPPAPPTPPPTQSDTTHPLGSAVASKEPKPASLTPDPPPAVVASDDFETEAKRLADAMVSASKTDRPTILAQLRDSKGGVYTEALARSAPRLSGESQQQVRDALAKRLTRMTGGTLRAMLKDRNVEIRGATAAAIGLKGDRDLVPNLIDVLVDPNLLVTMAARTSLRSLSGKDYGPEPGVDAEGKEQSANAWRTWWAIQRNSK